MKVKYKKILIVDDDWSFRLAVFRLLSAKGFEVIEMKRSIPVIQTILKEKPDLILLDLYMPHAGGMEIVNTIKRKKINIPVIIISGLLSEYDFQILREKGIDHFLAKPIDSKTLIEKVNDIFSFDSINKA